MSRSGCPGRWPRRWAGRRSGGADGPLYRPFTLTARS
eukprot:gene31582-19539_t